MQVDEGEYRQFKIYKAGLKHEPADRAYADEVSTCNSSIPSSSLAVRRKSECGHDHLNVSPTLDNNKPINTSEASQKREDYNQGTTIVYSFYNTVLLTFS